jgi:hypothetical protein
MTELVTISDVTEIELLIVKRMREFGSSRSTGRNRRSRTSARS